MYNCIECGEDADDDIYRESVNYLGHGEYDHIEEYYCVDCALAEGIICCRRKCEGDCQRDEWDEEVDDLVTQGKASYVG